MNRLNPLYIIGLFLTILFISFYLLSTSKDEFLNKNIEYLNMDKNAKDYKSFQSTWNNKVYVNNTLNQILKNKIYTNLKILRVETKNSIKLKVTSSDEKILNDFINKILNKQVIIKKLDIEKTYINIELEIN